MEENNGNQAYVTIATDDSYALGALVLGYSLRQVHTEKKLVILITSEVSDTVRTKLRKVFDEVRDVSLLDSRDEVHLSLMSRPELGKTYTKLHIWKLTEFSKCVFLDADTLVVKNCDELFQKEELSAVADVGWPDCFNSGVFVFVPSVETYQKLLQVASGEGSFDGGDQGLLNTYFNEWPTKDIANHLSFIYNMVIGATYTYLPAYKHYGHKVKIIHFLGSVKPWMHKHMDSASSFHPCEKCQYAVEQLKLWWDIYKRNVADISSDEEMEICKEMSNLVVGENANVSPQSHVPPEIMDNKSRQTSWEKGQIDYLGADSFDNIWNKIGGAIKNNNNEN